MRRLAASCVWLALVVPARAQAPSSHDPASLFPYEARVDVDGVEGLVRVPLTAAVLERTRSDLSDLRLHDGSDREVPFLVDSGTRPIGSEPTSVTYTLQPTEVDRRVGRGDSLRAQWRERLVVVTPGQAPVEARWRLFVDARRPSFVRRVVVRLLDGASVTEVARATVFRLQSPLRQRTFVDLPSDAAGQGGARLEVELVGEDGYIEPTIRLTATREPVEPATLTVSLPEQTRTERDGRTVIELDRPPGLTPDRIRVVTRADHFYRAVRVLDLAQGRAPRELGRGVVYRVREVEGATWLDVDVSRAEGERLRVVLEDGDSPPLEGLALEAVVRQPTLIFEASGEDLRLRFGGGRARAARYDLAAFSGTWLGDRMVTSDAPEVGLGDVGENPRFDDGPALRFAMRPGRAPVRSRFTHVAPVEVSGAREGLSRLRLPPEVLALAREDLADIRFVGADGRQWPYLRTAYEESDRMEVRVGSPEVGDRRSTHAFTLPVAQARVNRLVIHSAEPYLARPYVLWATAEGRRSEVMRGELRRAPDEARPLEVSFRAVRVSQLELEVEDGNDAPIMVERAELYLPSPTFFLAAPDGAYELLVGDPDAQDPEYEITRAADLVLAVRAAEGAVGPPSANPAHVEPPWYASDDWHTWLLWAVLLLAVVVLGLLTFRLARHDSSASEPEAPAPVPRPQADQDPDDAAGTATEEPASAPEEGNGAGGEEPDEGTEPISF